MMNITRFLQEGSKFMAADRPDVYDVDTAFKQLSHMFNYLANEDEGGEISTAGFILQKFVSDEDGMVEYFLNRRVLEFALFYDEDVTTLVDWTEKSALSNIGLDIPDPTIDFDDPN